MQMIDIINYDMVFKKEENISIIKKLSRYLMLGIINLFSTLLQFILIWGFVFTVNAGVKGIGNIYNSTMHPEQHVMKDFSKNN